MTGAVLKLLCLHHSWAYDQLMLESIREAGGRFGFATRTFGSRNNLSTRPRRVAEWTPIKLGQLFFHSFLRLSFQNKSSLKSEERKTTSLVNNSLIFSTWVNALLELSLRVYSHRVAISLNLRMNKFVLIQYKCSDEFASMTMACWKFMPACDHFVNACVIRLVRGWVASWQRRHRQGDTGAQQSYCTAGPQTVLDILTGIMHLPNQLHCSWNRILRGWMKNWQKWSHWN